MRGARRVLFACSGVVLVALCAACDDRQAYPRTALDVESTLAPDAQTAAALGDAADADLHDAIDAWLASQPPPPPRLPPRRTISFGFIGDAPLQPIPPVRDPPWAHFSCQQCDEDYELP